MLVRSFVVGSRPASPRKGGRGNGGRGGQGWRGKTEGGFKAQASVCPRCDVGNATGRHLSCGGSMGPGQELGCLGLLGLGPSVPLSLCPYAMYPDTW